MVKLIDTPGKSLQEIQNGAYFRCFGNIHLSRLLSRVQSLVIKNGYELEKMVVEHSRRKNILVNDLDKLLSDQIIPEGLYLAEKKPIRKSNIIEGKGIEPDFLVLKRDQSSQQCFVIELKDGHEFDTKSSVKEVTNLEEFASINKDRLHYWIIHCKIVGINATSKNQIMEGFKRKVDEETAMTGLAFCKLLGLRYASIQQQRALDQVSNLKEFTDEIYKIKEVRNEICKKSNGSNSI